MIAVGVASAFGVLALGFAFLSGAAAFGDVALPFLSKSVGLVLVLVLPILAIAAIVRRTRGLAAIGMLLCSYLFAFTLWLWALLFVLTTWGWGAVILGVLLGGVGVVPISMLACITHGEWGLLGQTLLSLLLIFGMRFGSAWLVVSVSEAPGISSAELGA